MKKLPIFLILALFTFFISSCEDEDVPPAENEEEAITDITLTFTPQGGGTPVTATWTDADGEQGSAQPVLTPISLAANTTYTLDIDLINALDPADPESITEEVGEESEEHMFFYGWTNGLFTSPTGDGNIGADQRNDPVNYLDEDDNGLPLGLQTNWTTGAAATGTFRVILAHQPDEKSETSTSETGEPDVDITWNITVQ